MNNDIKQQHEGAIAAAVAGAFLSQNADVSEQTFASGRYTAKCRGPKEQYRAMYLPIFMEAEELKTAGKEDEAIALLAPFDWMLEDKWDDDFENLVTTVGKNYLLECGLAASALTTVGPFMGLINTNASAAAVGDTMASHAGWLEVGNANAPLYTSPRKTITFSAAASASKASTGTYTFAIITTGGTVGGCFLVLSTGAVSTIDNTSGTLYSAGAFTGGSKVVSPGDSLTVTYTATA